MKVNRRTSDIRVHQQRFSLSILVSTFVVLAAWTTIQMMILGEYINYEQISQVHVIAIAAYWLLAAAIFTFMNTYQINRRYEKPMRQFAEATRQVANGDFSVYVKPLHTYLQFRVSSGGYYHISLTKKLLS